MRFKIGQKVVCIKKGNWESVSGRSSHLSPDPKYNEIVIISKYSKELHNGIPLVEIHGYRPCYYENRFAPILNDLNEIEEALKNSVEI